MKRKPEEVLEHLRSYRASFYFNEELTGLLGDAIDTIEILAHERKLPEQPTNGEMLIRMVGGEMIMTDAEDAEGWVPVMFDEDWWNEEAEIIDLNDAQTCDGCKHQKAFPEIPATCTECRRFYGDGWEA